MAKATAPVTQDMKAKAADHIDVEVIKGGSVPPPNPTTGRVTTSELLETGQAPAVVGATQTPHLPPEPVAAPASLRSSPSSSPPAGSGGILPSDDPNADRGAQSGNEAHDPEQAFHHLRGAIHNIHATIANANHYSSLPIGLVERMLTRAVTMLGVIRAKT